MYGLNLDRTGRPVHDRAPVGCRESEGCVNPRQLSIAFVVCIVLAVVGAALIGVGDALLTSADNQQVAMGYGQPCHGPVACPFPGWETNEGMEGIFAIIIGSVIIAATLPLAVVFGLRARRS
jgi:hypothetical protein